MVILFEYQLTSLSNYFGLLLRGVVSEQPNRPAARGQKGQYSEREPSVDSPVADLDLETIS